MSLRTCIPDMLKRGDIDPTRAARMGELFDELEAFYRRSMGPDAAAAEASEATLKHLAGEARLKKRQTLLQINRRVDALKDMERFTGKSRYAAVSALIDDDDRAPYRGGNVVFNAQRIEFGIHGRIAGFIERHRRTLRGRPADARGLDDVVRELHGQATGNARAKGFADAIADSFETLRQRFNSAGGHIGKIEGHGLPHRHDALKVRAVGREKWIGDVWDLLDRSKMIDDRTGVPFSDGALREVLGDVYETIRTNGLTGDAPTAFRGPGKLANRRAEHRFLHFRDGDAWLAYDRAYGSGDNPFTAIMGHVSGMSRDIAMMERLGPNPDATVTYLLDHVDHAEAQGDKKIVGAVQGKARGRDLTETLWRYVKGESTVPVLPESRLGYHAVRTVQGTRNLLTAAMLGSAPLSAISDIRTGTMTRELYGLSAISPANTRAMVDRLPLLPEMVTFGRYLKQLSPLAKGDRQLAARLGLGMQDAAHSLGSIARYYGETSGPGWTQALADGVLRASLLNRMTEAGQNLMGLDLLGTLGGNRHLAWADLPAELRTAMERNGLDQHDWSAIRHAPPIRSGSGEYVDPAAIMVPASADRLMNMVLRARAAAVIETSASSRAYVTSFGRPGTVAGEIIRNSLQFKGFTAAMMIKQARIISTLGPYRGAAYAARFVVGMTLFGAMTIQLREIAKGNDPRPMDNKEFWIDALLQSGGIGIFGDIIGSFQNDRLSGGVASLTAGPIGSAANDTAQAVRTALPGKVRKDGTRRAGNPAGAALRLAQRYTPGTNLWYLRAAFERMVIDQLDAQIDPAHTDRIKRQQRRAKDNRQDMWWEPDAMFPSRAPDLSNAYRNDQGANP